MRAEYAKGVARQSTKFVQDLASQNLLQSIRPSLCIRDLQGQEAIASAKDRGDSVARRALLEGTWGEDDELSARPKKDALRARDALQEAENQTQVRFRCADDNRRAACEAKTGTGMLETNEVMHCQPEAWGGPHRASSRRGRGCSRDAVILSLRRRHTTWLPLLTSDALLSLFLRNMHGCAAGASEDPHATGARDRETGSSGGGPDGFE